MNSSKYIVKVSFWIIFLNYVLESFLMYFDDRFFIILLQVFSNIYLIALCLFSSFKIKNHSVFSSAVLIILFHWITLPFSSDFIISANMLVKFSIPFFYLWLGLNIRNKDLLMYWFNRSWIFLAYAIVTIIASNLLNFGDPLYGGGIRTGYFPLNGLYLPVIVSIFMIFHIKSIKSKTISVLTIVTIIGALLIALLLLKRTFLIMYFVAILFFLYRRMNVKTFLNITVVGIVAFFIFQSYFVETFNTQVSTRESRFDEDYEVTEEGRFTENIYALEVMSNMPFSFIWGTGEVFNNIPYLSKYYYNERELHNSYIRILWNTGIIGLFLFLIFYFIQLKYFLKYSRSKISKGYADFFYSLLAIVFIRFLNDFSSGITYIAYNSFSYLLIGYGFSLILNRQKNINKLEKPQNYG